MTQEIKSVPVIKAADEELKQVLFIAMLPDSVDLHGDYTSAVEVRKAKESFNKSQMNANLYHEVMTDKFEVIEPYLGAMMQADGLLLRCLFLSRWTSPFALSLLLLFSTGW